MLKIIKYIFYSPVDILLLLIGIGIFRKKKLILLFHISLCSDFILFMEI